MSAFQAKAAWSRLQALIPWAQSECFGLPGRTFRRARARGFISRRKLVELIERYQLDADYVLHGRDPLGFVEQFPSAIARAAYASADRARRLTLFAYVALQHYLQVRQWYADATFTMAQEGRAVISVPLKGTDAILVELDAEAEIILTLRLNLGGIPMPLLAAQCLPASMEQFHKIITRHKKTGSLSRTAVFEKSRKQSQEFMSSWHFQTHKNTDDQQP